MHINNVPGEKPEVDHAYHCVEGPVKTDREVASLGVPAGASSTRTTAPEIAGLAAKASETPEVRELMVAQATARLATGEFLTPLAAERTAEAMLR